MIVVKAAAEPSRLNHLAADFWLNAYFRAARRHTWFVDWSKRFWVASAWQFSDHLYGGLMANATRILGPASTKAEREALAHRTLGSFYDFVRDVGHAQGLSVEQLRQRIESVEGHANYVAARQAKTGVIIVTAHMGSFEVGVAGLLTLEKKIHVLFRPDERGRFEQIRSTLRQKLGVIEEPVDQGWTLWMRLRDALARDEAVLIQGDRVMSGQKGQAIPLLGGQTLLPIGPAKLALASGAPILPVFSIRTREGKIRLYVEEPIRVAPDADSVDSALRKLGAVLEKYIRRYPNQWLANRPAWIEDADLPTLRAPMSARVDRMRQVLRSGFGLLRKPLAASQGNTRENNRFMEAPGSEPQAGSALRVETRSGCKDGPQCGPYRNAELSRVSPAQPHA